LIDAFTAIAPSGIVVAMGVKGGFGPGVVDSRDHKAVVFGGIVAYVAFSVGVSATGATSAGLMDCIRIDRTLALYLGIEATVLKKYTTTLSNQVWQKQRTNQIGSRCPKL
jgi:hypothetical protein